MAALCCGGLEFNFVFVELLGIKCGIIARQVVVQKHTQTAV